MNIEYPDVLQKIAPCGLNCGKCYAMKGGSISVLSGALKMALGNFSPYAQRFYSLVSPIFADYEGFARFLNLLENADCHGCRAGTCKYPGCNILACTKEHGVDFCGMCPKFPCDEVNFDQNLKTRWLSMNNSIKIIGIQAYYFESSKENRYP